MVKETPKASRNLKDISKPIAKENIFPSAGIYNELGRKRLYDYS